MNAHEEVLLHVYCEGLHYEFIADTLEGRSTYGGPQERSLKGIQHGPHRLHQVAEIVGSNIPLLHQLYIFGLPLVYGFRFDGCYLTYKFEMNEIEVISLKPTKSADDWPYFDYPSLLPYVAMNCKEPTKKSWTSFEEQFTNLSDEQPAQLVAVAPPPRTLHYSMWGKGGDQGDVSVVFECDLQKKLVTTYNICD